MLLLTQNSNHSMKMTRLPFPFQYCVIIPFRELPQPSFVTRLLLRVIQTSLSQRPSCLSSASLPPPSVHYQSRGPNCAPPSKHAAKMDIPEDNGNGNCSISTKLWGGQFTGTGENHGNLYRQKQQSGSMWVTYPTGNRRNSVRSGFRP